MKYILPQMTSTFTFNSSNSAPLATSRQARAPWTAISRVGASKITWTLWTSRLTMFRALTTKTSVLPVPDFAWTTRSTPKLASGKADHWTGDGLRYPAPWRPRMSLNRDNQETFNLGRFRIEKTRSYMGFKCKSEKERLAVDSVTSEVRILDLSSKRWADFIAIFIEEESWSLFTSFWS